MWPPRFSHQLKYKKEAQECVRARFARGCIYETEHLLRGSLQKGLYLLFRDARRVSPWGLRHASRKKVVKSHG